jgi:8-oxo-dGTP pyrophosphatase MutT (NUDIX family)
MTETTTEARHRPSYREDETKHPYFRPRDAATLILIDRTNETPKVLVGKRHDKVVFMPSAFVFPGGRVDAKDNRIPAAARIPAELEARLHEGSPKTSPSRARALALTAIREACEETGLCIGRKVDGPDKHNDKQLKKLTGGWQPFADAGLLPDPSSLFLIARAITPPGRVKRLDTRFFTSDASAIVHHVPGVVHADAELVELVWVEIDAKPLAAMHPMTVQVLGHLRRRLATGPLRHDAPIPFMHFYNGKMQTDTLPGKA